MAKQDFIKYHLREVLRGAVAEGEAGVGFSVASVPDYPEALLKLGEFKPDLVILDEVLPGRDGIEACSELYRIFGIPVILLGKDPSAEIWKRAVEAGADLYLRKPFSHLELATRVEEYALWSRLLDIYGERG